MKCFVLPTYVNKLAIPLGHDAFIGTIILGVVACIGGGLIYSLVVEGKYEGRDWPVFLLASSIYTLSLNVELKETLYRTFPNTLDAVGKGFDFFGFTDLLGKGSVYLN
jgi:uncharacterized membrane protein YeiH